MTSREKTAPPASSAGRGEGMRPPDNWKTAVYSLAIASGQDLCARRYRPLPAAFRKDVEAVTDAYGATIFRFMYWPATFGCQCDDVDGEDVAFLRDLLDGGDEARIIGVSESFALMTGRRYQELRGDPPRDSGIPPTGARR